MENLTVIQLSASEIRAIIREELINILGNQQLQTNKSENQDEIMNFEQACAFLSTPISTLYYYTSNNMIPHVKRGKKLFFVKADLVEWIKEGKKRPEATEKKEDYFLLKLRQKGKIKNNPNETKKKASNKTV